MYCLMYAMLRTSLFLLPLRCGVFGVLHLEGCLHRAERPCGCVDLVDANVDRVQL